LRFATFVVWTGHPQEDSENIISSRKDYAQ